MHVSKLLPTAVMTLALSLVTGCAADVTTPAKEASSSLQTTGAPSTGAADSSAGGASGSPPSSTAKPLQLTGTNNVQSADCRGRDTTIDAESSSFFIEGDCGTVTVSGSHNSIYVESADILTVRGNVNGVAVKIVSTLRVEGLNNTAAWVRASNGDHPEVTAGGATNRVVRVSEQQYNDALTEDQEP
ncbi:DUF3060 domain-containing protein [Streptomyces virginiae]|uniref:DUF3060 domain-containing protein n=1 Tax=Streptomyces TaxID=1883 RepID=UPI002887F6F0|nr:MULTISPECIES: DUF3060 domain-containing protein [Streptomyces]MDT0513969.1 DUF3060 domain-containing protein [Streptomyces sp. DSM 41633]